MWPPEAKCVGWSRQYVQSWEEAQPDIENITAAISRSHQRRFSMLPLSVGGFRPRLPGFPFAGARAGPRLTSSQVRVVTTRLSSPPPPDCRGGDAAVTLLA